MMIKNLYFQNSFKTYILVFLFFLFQIPTSIIAQNSDREERQPPTNQGINLDFSAGSTSFYYVDQIGMTLGMSGVPASDIIDLETYRLGPGDLLTITLTGNISGVYRGLPVNQQGDIVIPNVGTVKVFEKLLDEAQADISEAVSKTFKDTESNLTLEYPRMIKVHVAGDVPYPGSYYIPSQTRLDKAILRSLFQPRATIDHETGETTRTIPNLSRQFLISGQFSTRNISIKRNGGSNISADLVAYGVGGDLNGNPVVKHNDVITIHEQQPYAPKISVSGAVLSPLLLEYRPDDSISRLMHLAGGLSVDANPDDIRIYRQENGQIRTIMVKENDMMTPLEPNDRIVVGFDREARSNKSAWVYGEAESPGNFPVRQGETSVLELLEMAGGMTNNALPKGAFLVRSEPESSIFDGEPSENTMIRQRLMATPPIFSENFNLNEAELNIQMMQNPAFNAERLKRTSDQLLEGFDYLNLEAILNRNEVFIDLTNPDQLAATKVYGGDELYIPRDDQTIFVMGQVRNPGYYTVEANKNATDYIQNAGGFALAADENRLFVIKAGSKTWYKINETSVESGDIIFVDRKPFDNVVTARQDQFQRRELQNRNIQLIFAGIATVASVVTAYVAVTR